MSTVFHAVTQHAVTTTLDTSMIADDFGRRLAIASAQFYGRDAEHYTDPGTVAACLWWSWPERKAIPPRCGSCAPLHLLLSSLAPCFSFLFSSFLFFLFSSLLFSFCVLLLRRQMEQPPCHSAQVCHTFLRAGCAAGEGSLRWHTRTHAHARTCISTGVVCRVLCSVRLCGMECCVLLHCVLCRSVW